MATYQYKNIHCQYTKLLTTINMTDKRCFFLEFYQKRIFNYYRNFYTVYIQVYCKTTII